LPWTSTNLFRKFLNFGRKKFWNFVPQKFTNLKNRRSVSPMATNWAEYFDQGGGGVNVFVGVFEWQLWTQLRKWMVMII